jgi:tetratricopeptide (TPR) repeat protein
LQQALRFATQAGLQKPDCMIPAEWLKYAPKPKPLTNGNTWNVFLSYRSVDRPWVLNLYDVLTEIGHKVFLDQYVLKPGDKLIQQLEQALSSSQAGILIWSGATKDSVWVNDEYETLQRRANEDKNFIFVPVKIDNSRLPAFAANRIYIDFTSYPDGPNGGDLLRLLHALADMPMSAGAIHFAAEQDEAAAVAIARVNAAIRNNRPDRLLELFEQGGLVWKTSAALGCKVAEGLTRLGEYDRAVEVLDKVETLFPDAIRPKQLKGLALARRGREGDLENAQEILGTLLEENNLDSETMGIYGRTWMDRYSKSGRQSDLRQSRKYYAAAFERQPHDYYTGINAASKSVLLGEMDKALHYANRVEEIVGREAANDDYWKTATVAEVMLIKGNFADAAAMYQHAIDIAPNDAGSIKSTGQQAEKLIAKLAVNEADKERLREVFKPYA